ncbi:MAG: hypothetical protein MUC49_02650 [Raineya sp.]|jgi:hypothetical protein|nr:hypothetical protein [Raineya sp.]
MKKLNFLFFSIIFLFLSFSGFAQQSKNQWVVGTWKVAKLEIPHYEQLIAKATPEKKKQIEKEIDLIAQSGLFQFKADGTYYIQFSGNKEAGKWKLNQYASKLIKEEKMPNGQFMKPEEIGIESLSKNTMILLNDYEGGEIIRLTLKK